ncbi:hypothetical protein MGN70_011878 [Eutypa lata]|uniref:Uncharacterized protein n=1 Tax=Eutypa lata (strain UCR-EL1) TaxID=1287681 RepID=M7SWT9_EUTLA|nr:putative proteinase propeptide protein [Eutypa lata UCREL1]KAI1244990.1 hypothetical protein MGN70_011878 [Eutypa lata]
MRVVPTILAGLAVISGVFAKSIIVSFPPETAQSVVDTAKADFKAAGGEITHEYRLINGFSGKIPDTMTESVTTWSEKYNANVEEDQVVTAYDNGSS